MIEMHALGSVFWLHLSIDGTEDVEVCMGTSAVLPKLFVIHLIHSSM